MNKAKKSDFQKLAIGLLALGFLIAGALVSATDMLAMGSQEFAAGTLLKVGFVLALCWIAAPQLERLGWEKLRGNLLVVLAIVLVLLVIRPRIGAIAAAVFIGGALLMSLIGWFRNLSTPRK